MDGTVYQYSSSGDENADEDVIDIVVKKKRRQSSSCDENTNDDINRTVVRKKRGKGMAWLPIKVHDNIAAAKSTIDATRKAGRINRGRTVAFYYYCEFKSCGCKVQWRYASSLSSFEIVEEQSDDVHTCHDLLLRNGGRGLSFEQVKTLEDAAKMRITKPISILAYYERTAKALLEKGS